MSKQRVQIYFLSPFLLFRLLFFFEFGPIRPGMFDLSVKFLQMQFLRNWRDFLQCLSHQFFISTTPQISGEDWRESKNVHWRADGQFLTAGSIVSALYQCIGIKNQNHKKCLLRRRKSHKFAEVSVSLLLQGKKLNCGLFQKHAGPHPPPQLTTKFCLSTTD